MPRLRYKIGYIDLRQDIETLFSKISCRTEIRKAEKSQITIRAIENGLSAAELQACRNLLKCLLDFEKVSYDVSFDELLSRKDIFHFLAYQHDHIVSFITIEVTNRNDALKNFKTVYLALSATDERAKRDCPNYLLIWEASKFLKNRGFEVFNLGLLEFINGPDDAVDRVAFFKRKWNIVELIMEKNVNFGKWFYYRYLKRFFKIRNFLYTLKKFINKN